MRWFFPAIVLLPALAGVRGTFAATAEPAPPPQQGPQQPQPQGPPAPPTTPAAPAFRRWSNSTELSLVLTDGNSSVQTLGFKDTLEHKYPAGRSRYRVDALRSDTSDDPYRLVEPGLTFLPGELPVNYSTIEVRPGAEPDVARYFAEGRYDGNFKKRTKNTWNAGASWDRNEDAGILNRYIVFSGLGRTWVERPDRTFRTSYSLSWTDREEDIFDPEKEQRFPGVRVGLDFMDKWGKTTTYDNDFTYNVNVEDLQDFNADWIQGIGVSMSSHLALKVSLQFTYASEPALEEVDVLVRAMLVDPDGIPGTGDEFFQTVASGGSEIKIGDGSLRKQELDTTFRTSLQITF